MTNYEMAIAILKREGRPLTTQEILQISAGLGWRIGDGAVDHQSRKSTLYGTLQRESTKANSLVERIAPNTWQIASSNLVDSVDISPLLEDEPEGIESNGDTWRDYPLDDLLIRHETRTIQDVVRRIEQKRYIMDPDFQRDFIWEEAKQSKLIESVAMRIPLPVFYLAEDIEGRMIVVDGLQRLSTFTRFFDDKLVLALPEQSDLHKRRFSDLSPKLKNRIEDCNLIFYIIDSKVPERAKLDIFERVNSGLPLTRQQMRNALFSGNATRFLREETQSTIFLEATGKGLNRRTMRDREFVNRFCAFDLLGHQEYPGDMDDYLARCLVYMNQMDEKELSLLSAKFHRGLHNNLLLFKQHAFRRHSQGQQYKTVLNASLWDVMSTGLSNYREDAVLARSNQVKNAVYDLLEDPIFVDSITRGTSGGSRVKTRFAMSQQALKESLGAFKN